MRWLLRLIAFFALVLPASAQQYVVLKTDNFSVTGNGGTVRTIGTSMTFVRISWNIVGGTLSACTVKIQTSADAASWSDLSGSSVTCTSNGAGTFIGVTPNYMRAVLVTKTGSATTLTTTLVGWMALPVAVIATPGAPVGACTDGTLYQNTTTGDLYLCESGAWVLISFGGGGAVSGSGTANTLTKWTGATSLGNTAIDETTAIITITGEPVDLKRTGIGATPTIGLEQLNTTAAVVGTQVQASPYLRFAGAAWDTDGLSSDDHSWKLFNLPTAGTTTSSKLIFQSFQTGGSYTSRFALPSTGFTAAAIPFIGSDGFTLSQEVTNLFWDTASGQHALIVGNGEQASGKTVASFGESYATNGLNGLVEISSKNDANVLFSALDTKFVDGSGNQWAVARFSGINNTFSHSGSLSIPAIEGTRIDISDNATDTTGSVVGGYYVGSISGNGKVAAFISNNITAGTENYFLYGNAGQSFLNDRLTVKSNAAQVNRPSFTGGGLNDATTGGTYTGTSDLAYCASVDATVPSPDTFSWGTAGSCTSGATGVSMSAGAHTLSNGVTITFAATDGHTIGNHWDWNAYAPIPLTLQDHSGNTTLKIVEGGTESMYGGLVTAGLGHSVQVGVVRAVAQVAAIGGTTIFTVGAANAMFDAKFALNCTTTSAAATVNVTLGWTDTGSQAQTATLGSAVVCTALGASSIGSLSFSFSAKAATTITYSTAIVNTPTYDIRGTLYQDTIN